MKNNWAKYFFIFLIFSVLLTPFFVFRDLLFPYVTSKAFFLRIAVELALPFYLFLIVIHKQFRPSLKNPLTVSVLAFWAINFISALFGVNIAKSLWGNFERMGGAYYLLHLTLVYFYLLLLARINPIIFSRFLKSAVVISGMLSVYGSLVAAGMHPWVADPSLPRISIVFGNPIYVGSFLILPMFLSAFLALQGEKLWEKVMYWFFAGIQLLAIYLSGTRGAVVGLAMGLFLAGAAYIILVKKRRVRIIGSAIFAGFILTVGLLYFFHNSMPQGSTLRRVFNLNDSNTQARLIQWKTALKGLKDYPVLGAGPENYYIIANKYHNPEIGKYDKSWFDKPHNYLLEILVTSGSLGFLAYLSILAFGFFAIWRAFKKGFFGLFEFIVLETGLVVYQIQNLFVFDNVSASLMFYVYFAFAGFLWQESSPPLPKQKNKEKNWQYLQTFGYAVFAVSCLVCLYALYATEIIPMRISKNVNYGYAYSSVDPKKGLGYFDKALSLPFNIDPGETAMKYADFVLAAQQNPRLKSDPDFVKENIDRSINTLEELVRQIGNYPIYWHKLANIYVVKAVFEKTPLSQRGEEALQTAINLAPKRMEARMFKAQLRAMQGNNSEAFEIIRQVASDYPADQDVLWQKALLEKQMGQITEAVLIAEGLIKQDYKFRNWRETAWIGDYYKQNKDYEKLFALYEKLSKDNILDMDGYWQLAKDYMTAGQRDKALELGNKILKAEPNRKQEILDFFRGLNSTSTQ
ncbi:MAG: O-antigen ligase family protein [Candidatus Doudnabacteria bacterium]|nr:O-antigen ligase family protein [Candidatus Doudnabacteria bacterium]